MSFHVKRRHAVPWDPPPSPAEYPPWPPTWIKSPGIDINDIELIDGDKELLTRLANRLGVKIEFP